MKSDYHKPVLLEESINGLNIRPGGIYVDVTFGGGGHSSRMLQVMKGGKLIAFDRDADTRENIIDDRRLIMVDGNFRYLKNYLKYFNAYPCDGILADLGVSSHQINDPKRGFSTRFDGPLDFRMNEQQSFSGEELLNTYPFEKMTEIFKQYGELRNARAIANAICKAREENRLTHTGQLKEIVEKLAPAKTKQKFWAKVFQAIRIEVNQELDALKDMLEASADVLKTGGRLVVIAYHSLEDRIIKNMVKTGNTQGIVNKDFYGNILKSFEAVNKNIITASGEEIRENPRARSAKLRIAKKK